MLDWAGESQYYVEPKRLARLGYLDARKEPGQTRERTVYTLTDKGLDALAAWAQTPVHFTALKSEALLRLLITDLVGEAATRTSMITLRDDIDDLLARLDETEAAARASPTGASTCYWSPASCAVSSSSTSTSWTRSSASWTETRTPCCRWHDRGVNQLRSFNPATGELVGSVGVTAPEDVQRVVDEVAEVQPFWSQLALEDRGRYLRRAAQVIVDETDDIRDLIAREQGKPRTEAYLMEVLPDDRRAALDGRARARDPGRRAIPTSQPLLQDQALGLHLRAARRDRRDRAVELPVDDPARRGRDGADGRQRRRPQAGLAHAA